MTRPSRLASAPSRSPRPAEMSCRRPWQAVAWALTYRAQGDYRRAIDCFKEDRGGPRREAALRGLRADISCLP